MARIVSLTMGSPARRAKDGAGVVKAGRQAQPESDPQVTVRCVVRSTDPGHQLESGRSVRRDLREAAEHLLDGADRVMQLAADKRARRDGAELEARHDAEVASTPAQGPEEIRIAVRSGDDAFAGRGHDLCPDDVVAGEPLDAGQPADPATQRQPTDTGVPVGPTDDREIVRPGGDVDVFP